MSGCESHLLPLTSPSLTQVSEVNRRKLGPPTLSSSKKEARLLCGEQPGPRAGTFLSHPTCCRLCSFGQIENTLNAESSAEIRQFWSCFCPLESCSEVQGVLWDSIAERRFWLSPHIGLTLATHMKLQEKTRKRPRCAPRLGVASPRAGGRFRLF